MTLGKKLGLIAFIISESIISILTILYISSKLFKIETDITAMLLITSQLTVMTITWGTKSVANFKPQTKE